MRQVSGSFPSESGLAYLLITDRAEHWDEAAIVAMIESIRIGSAGPAGDAATKEVPPEGASAESASESPAEAPADSPTVPPADSAPATSSTQESDTETPQ